MQPPVPLDPAGQDIAVDTLHGAWNVPDFLHDGKKQLFFRHAAFGWVGFLLEEQNAAALAKALSQPLTHGEVAGSA
jgi:hypothetical protein